MDKLNEIKTKLHFLSSEQLDIIHRLISSWNIKGNKIQTDENLVKKIYESTISPIEDPLKNYSKEELLEEYGVLFYNQQNTVDSNFGEVSIEYNYDDSDDIIQKFVNNPIQTKEFKIEELVDNDIKLTNLDSKSSITDTKTNVSNIALDDFDPLFPDTDFDSLTGLNKSKYDNLDFSALISKKPK
ncbi:hypothetical protein [Gemella haemolysans]|uniref:hypothetical protein n=1 Tax=Gemella haemolysans TaxID=1379 RepID=UPI0019561F75|nr:hypothetical protein [Gemella haemolysans]VTX60237.1 Uncharacterised protein [Gemella haemolysans]